MQPRQRQGGRAGGRWLLLLLAPLLPVLFGERTRAADRIVLRDLERFTGRTVEHFDEDGVQLDDGTRLGWGEIKEARIGEGQAEFDALLGELGDPLYRIRRRLSVGDYRDVLSPAEDLYPRYETRSSETAYMVTQSLMWGRLEAGRREAALEPYLRCFALLKANPDYADRLPGDRRLKFDPETALTPELAPVWFDSDAAGAVMRDVYETVRRMARPRPPGVYVYWATLALAAGQEKAAEQVWKAIRTDDAQIRQLKQIVEAQREVIAGRPEAAQSQLQSQVEQMSQRTRPLGLYWLGMAKLASEDQPVQKAGMLDLLRIPAAYGDEYPELAAAALYQSMQSLTRSDDAVASVAVRNELLSQYGQTYFARRAKSSSSHDSR